MEAEQETPNGIGGLYVKVMTDEQMELLRHQISVYATICEQLVEMHKAVTTQQDLAGSLSLSLSLSLSKIHYVTFTTWSCCIVKTILNILAAVSPIFIF